MNEYNNANMSFIDATNICYWKDTSAPTLTVLLHLLIDLKENKKSDFYCIFDANTLYKLPEGEKNIYRKLLNIKKYFYQVTGGKRADDFLLELADTYEANIISNDNYNDKKYDKYKWKDRDYKPQRLFMGEVLPVLDNHHLIIAELDIHVHLNESIEGLYNKLCRLLVATSKIRGRIKFYNKQENWGRIAYEDDIYFNRKSFEPNTDNAVFAKLQEGLHLEFSISHNDKGKYAQQIIPISDEEQKLHQGTVDYYDEQKMLGAIRTDEGEKTLFFYKSYIADPSLSALYKDQRVEFNIGTNKNGACARNISVLDKNQDKNRLQEIIDKLELEFANARNTIRQLENTLKARDNTVQQLKKQRANAYKLVAEKTGEDVKDAPLQQKNDSNPKQSPPQQKADNADNAPKSTNKSKNEASKLANKQTPTKGQNQKTNNNRQSPKEPHSQDKNNRNQNKRVANQPNKNAKKVNNEPQNKEEGNTTKPKQTRNNQRQKPNNQKNKPPQKPVNQKDTVVKSTNTPPSNDQTRNNKAVNKPTTQKPRPKPPVKSTANTKNWTIIEPQPTQKIQPKTNAEPNNKTVEKTTNPNNKPAVEKPKNNKPEPKQKAKPTKKQVSKSSQSTTPKVSAKTPPVKSVDGKPIDVKKEVKTDTPPPTQKPKQRPIPRKSNKPKRSWTIINDEDKEQKQLPPTNKEQNELKTKQEESSKKTTTPPKNTAPKKEVKKVESKKKATSSTAKVKPQSSKTPPKTGELPLEKTEEAPTPKKSKSKAKRKPKKTKNKESKTAELSPKTATPSKKVVEKPKVVATNPVAEKPKVVAPKPIQEPTAKTNEAPKKELQNKETRSKTPPVKKAVRQPRKAKVATSKAPPVVEKMPTTPNPKPKTQPTQRKVTVKAPPKLAPKPSVATNTLSTTDERKSWWKTLDNQWKKALNVVAGKGEILRMPSDAALQKVLRIRRLSFFRTSKNKLSFKLTSLKGLSKMKQLTHLNLSEHALADLKGIENLSQLTHLNINKNGLKSIEGIDQLKRLQELNCNRNQLKIQSFKYLDERLPQLKKLDCRDNNFSDMDKKKIEQLLKIEEVKV